MTALLDIVDRPAALLSGRQLANGWTILERMERGSNQTGGYFSVGYAVQKADGTRGFLKAFDFSSIANEKDPLRELQILLESYNFERDLLDFCKERRLTKVAMALEDGSIDVAGAGILSKVYYVIFERAQGDIRSYVDFNAGVDVAWRLATLHQAAVGLWQLHRQLIAHQDVKPSNLLVFGSGSVSKIADLGRAWRDGHPAPHDNNECAGQVSYAPIELLYQHVESDSRIRRLGTDLYLFGSLILFFFGNVGMTAALLSELEPSQQPGVWTGDYLQLLPYVEHAFNNVCIAFRQGLSGVCSPRIADELSLMVKYLCDPDPKRRGHPLNRRSLVTQFSLERFIGRLNFLATEASMPQ